MTTAKSTSDDRRFPFPAVANGWFRLAYSDELAAGQVLPLSLLDRELVLYRDEQGGAHAVDAYCPHLGAHLGHGGKVEGSGIRCPFHNWLWMADGSCGGIPYSDHVPPRARIHCWPLAESNGIIMAWHHDAGLPPSFEIPTLPELESADWTPLVVRKWTIKSHWLDMNENSVDQVHFEYVHGTATQPATTAEVEGHLLKCRSRMKMSTPRGKIDGGIDTDDHGPGFQVVRVHGELETLMINTATPIDDELTDVSFAYSIKAGGDDKLIEGIGASIIRDLEKQMAQDIVIWEHKRYHRRPLLCEADGPLSVYRQWMSQFFSEGAMTS